MKRPSSDERDYAFGQAMFTLRTRIGMTQASLAELLGVSRKAVGRWEAGSSYPRPEVFKTILALAVGQQAFPDGREEEEIRAFWHAAHQKILLDERWLQELLGQQRPQRVLQGAEEMSNGRQIMPRSAPEPRTDWSEALMAPSFYGRVEELTQLMSWVVEEHCRVVSVLGLGGIGKSALTIRLMHQAAHHFDVVIWRSLRDVPACEALLDECLQVLAPQSLGDVSTSLEQRISLLLKCVRTRRVLLVLDNMETLLEKGQGSGRMRPGYEGYAYLLQRMAETEHQSCLLFTSREKPVDLVPLEGGRTLVRVLRLARLDADACGQLLAEKDVVGGAEERIRLIEMYGGNPLALKIVAQTVVDLFGGEITPLLGRGDLIFGGVRELLNEQYMYLTELEQTVLCWLAIVREPMTVSELHIILVVSTAPGELLEAFDGLWRRSLIERGQRAGSFTLQSVVLEYVTARIIVDASGELEQGQLALLLQHGLSQASARDYVRQTQERLLVRPLLERLQSILEGRTTVEAQLSSLLDQLRTRAENVQGYGPANLVVLLHMLRGNLRGLDLSYLSLRDLFLQGVEMQDTLLVGAILQKCVFTDAFEGVSAIAISNSGQYWAAGSDQGNVWVWDEEGHTLRQMVKAHMDRIRGIAFSPDGGSLVTGSWDNTVKQWNVASGALSWSNWQTSNLASVSLAPDGRLLATSGGADATVHLWDLHSGAHTQTQSHPSPVSALAWSPDGRFLASGCIDGSILVWERPWLQPIVSMQTRLGHTSWVMSLAFAPASNLLASGGWDSMIRLWELPSGRLQQELAGHMSRVNRVIWSGDGQTFASCGRDQTIRLWDLARGSTRMVLLGHSGDIFGLTFTRDNLSLLSGSDDGSLRLWEVASGRCTHIMRGHVSSLFGLDWSPDGTQLVSGGADTLVTEWDVNNSVPGRELRGHRWAVSGVGWSPDGRWLASSGWDNAIRLWDRTSGTCIQIPEHPESPDTIFFSVAWSPNGQYLASGTYANGVLVWDVRAHRAHWFGHEHPTGIRHVAWSPDGTQLAGTGDSNVIYVWAVPGGALLRQLPGHQGITTSLAWSSDGTWLASGGRTGEHGSLLVWDMQRGERVLARMDLVAVLSAVTWDASGNRLISGDSEGELCWWDIPSGECMVRVHKAHQGTVQALKRSPDGQRLASCGDDGAIMLWDPSSGAYLQTLRRDRPYERLNITGIKGLSEAQKETLCVLGAIEDSLTSFSG